MRSCPACNAELSESDIRCPRCGHTLAGAQLWSVRFSSRESLRVQFEQSLVHHGLVAPRPEATAPGATVWLCLVLPEGAGELQLTARAVGSVAHPSRPEAPYDVQLQLLDLDANGLERLRRAAHGEDAAATCAAEAPLPAATAEAAPSPAPPRLALDTDSDAAEIDALLDELLQPWEAPPAPEAPAAALEIPEAQPIPTRERPPEEVARDLTEFTLHLVRAVTKSSYYTAGHREAEQAKAGLFAAFTKLVAHHPEVTFCARAGAGKCSMLVYGIFDEPSDLAQAMRKDMADMYIPRLSQYCESNGLISISFKRALEEGEFHRFVDLLAGPGGAAHGAGDRTVQKLAELRIHNISLVVQEDQLARRHLSWRVEMALTRLKKDLSVIPLYVHLSKEELQRVRLQVFRDVVRPLRQVNLVRELLENCDLVVAEIDELSQENLAELEAQILASVTEKSLPALLEGLAADLAEAKREDAERMAQLLRLVRRVVQRLTREQVEELENAFRLLYADGALRVKELPAFMQHKLAIEHKTQVFLDVQEHLLRCFDSEGNPGTYQTYLNFFETILPELLSPTHLPAAARLLHRVSHHCTSPAPFEERGEVAEAWLEHLTRTWLGRKFVERLQNADHVNREALFDFAREFGDTGVALLFAALRESEGGPCRQDLVRTLAELKVPSLCFLREQMERSDLPPNYLCDLLSILARVGDPGVAELASRFLEHAEALVRMQALRTAADLDPCACERWALDALADRDARIQDAALKLLFAQRSTAPALFDFCRRILSNPDEADQEMAQRICCGVAGYERGDARTRSVALLLSVLEGVAPRARGWWSGVRRSVAGEPAHQQLKIVACQALGRMGAGEAVDVLTRLGKQKSPALRRAAQHALEQIAGQ
jgi:hypothetical protein